MRGTLGCWPVRGWAGPHFDHLHGVVFVADPAYF